MDVWTCACTTAVRRRRIYPSRTVAVIALRGAVRVDGADPLRDGQLVLLDQGSGGIVVDASTAATLLVLSGDPLDEPVAPTARS